MPIKSKENSIAAWAFLVGVVLAIVLTISRKIMFLKKFPKPYTLNPQFRGGFRTNDVYI